MANESFIQLKKLCIDQAHVQISFQQHFWYLQFPAVIFVYTIVKETLMPEKSFFSESSSTFVENILVLNEKRILSAVETNVLQR